MKETKKVLARECPVRTGRNAQSRMILVLEGCNGIGKSTMAKQLATKLSAIHVGELDPNKLVIGTLGQSAFYAAECIKLIKVLFFNVTFGKPVVVERSLLSPSVFQTATNIGKVGRIRSRLAVLILRGLAAILRKLTIVVMVAGDFAELKRRHSGREPVFEEAQFERMHNEYCRLANEDWILKIVVAPLDTPDSICERLLGAVER